MRKGTQKFRGLAAVCGLMSGTGIALTGFTLALGVMTGCKGSENRATGAGDTGGTLVITTAADADVLFPPLYASSEGRQVTEQLFEPLADIGDDMNIVGDKGFIPKLADSWEWAKDSLSIAFHLNSKARWHDGVPVTARDVQYTAKLYVDPVLASPAATSLADFDSVSVRDSLTPVVWLKRKSPQSFYTAAAIIFIVPEHVYGKIPVASMATSEILRKPVGSGPFKFVRWVPNSTIEVAANTAYYRKRASLDRVIWTIAPGDFNTAIARVLSGDADFLETLSPPVMAQVAKTPALKMVMYPGLDFSMLLFNEHDPKMHNAPHRVFGDRMVRRALTMGIDRVSIVKNVLDTLAAPAVGPTVRAFPSTDTTLAQIPYDPAAAMKLLDSLGWKVDARTGVRVKNGVPLAFTVITPSSSKNRERCAVLLQEQLRKIGAQMTIQPLEIAAFLKGQNDRTFDAAMTALHLDANPGGLKQSWGVAEAKNPKGSNAGSYMNPMFDAEVDSAMAVSSPEAAKVAFTKAYTTIINDAPAVWLYDLKGAVAVHKRVHLAPLRPDAWWTHLAEWSIPANERIARDAQVAPTQ